MQAGWFFISKALAVGFVGASLLAKHYPITHSGDYKMDAAIYMVMFGAVVVVWKKAR